MAQTKKDASVVPATHDPASILAAYDQGLYSVDEAANLMGVSRATFHRKLKVWRETGSVPLHGNAKRAPANKVPEELKKRVIDLIDKKYADFQATLLKKYLAKQEGIDLSTEWLRRLLIELHPEETSRERRQIAHRMRRRRASRGQLIQIDGSPHQWFESDERKYCLIAFIDDATSRIEAAGFFPSETTHAYVTVLRKMLDEHGLPAAMYSDRHSIFTSSVAPARETKTSEPTQFQRICSMLGIELILAHSPQAKGRVERAFKTLQGRWTKEFRVLGITTVAEANARLPELIAEYNREFSIAPADEEDSYIRLSDEEKNELEFIFGTWHRRSISRNLTVSNKKEILQIVSVGPQMRVRMQKTDVQLVEFDDGRIELYWHDSIEWQKACRREGRKLRKTYQRLNYKVHDRWDLKPSSEEYEDPPDETAKTIDSRMDSITTKRASPWRESMGRWAKEGIRHREEHQQKLQEAKAIETRIAEAKAAIKKPKG